MYYEKPVLRPQKNTVEKKKITLKEANFLGTAIAEDADFRKFTGDTYPIVYRSDTRTLGEIQKAKGFFPKHEKISSATSKQAAVINLSNCDMDTDYAVSFARQFAPTIIFPFDMENPPESGKLLQSTVYVCIIRQWLEIYSMQKILAKELTYVEEVASLGVPIQDVLGVCTIKKVYSRDNQEFAFERPKFQPNNYPNGLTKEAGNALSHFTSKILLTLREGKVKAAPKPKEEKKRIGGQELYNQVEKIMQKLKGTEWSNKVMNYRVPEIRLDDIDLKKTDIKV